VLSNRINVNGLLITKRTSVGSVHNVTSTVTSIPSLTSNVGSLSLNLSAGQSNLSLKNSANTEVATFDDTGDLVLNNGTAYISAGNLGMFRNRVINGDMRIDQRNAGTAVSVNSVVYTLDRMRASINSGTLSFQQVADAPDGVTNSLKITTTSTSASAAGTFTALEHFIEGTNITDLKFGKASATPIALSFWVKSSVAGTFGIGISNSANTRCYPVTYVINSANTWEYKTVIVSGDTTGAWLVDTNVGLRLTFDLGSGSSYEATSGAWTTALKTRTSACTRINATLNATIQFTCIQLEKGPIATPFEFRPYSMEAQLCRRYFEKSYSDDVKVGFAYTMNTNTSDGARFNRITPGASVHYALNGVDFYTFGLTHLKITKRMIPTLTIYSPNGTANTFFSITNGVNQGTPTFGDTGVDSFIVRTAGTIATGVTYAFHWVADSEL
jgi:hypothetical protein